MSARAPSPLGGAVHIPRRVIIGAGALVTIDGFVSTGLLVRGSAGDSACFFVFPVFGPIHLLVGLVALVLAMWPNAIGRAVGWSSSAGHNVASGVSPHAAIGYKPAQLLAAFTAVWSLVNVTGLWNGSVLLVEGSAVGALLLVRGLAYLVVFLASVQIYRASSTNAGPEVQQGAAADRPGDTP
jgi:hypothetical protein